MNETGSDINEPVKEKFSVFKFIMRLIYGAMIGLGAVLPGISGGVLCVVFGIYKPIMELLSHPIKAIKKYASLLIPTVIGIAAGFLGIAKLLGFLLERYEAPSMCVFIGLIAGMLPSLFREAGLKGRSKGSYISMGVAFLIVLGILLGIKAVSITIPLNFGSYIFCGFCLALSIIAPGMSFSTLLMPLGLYQPFVAGIGDFDFGIILPAAIGAILTIILLAKLVTMLMDKHYSIVFHAIIGIVIAATVIIIPFSSFTLSFTSAAINVICLIIGIVAALLLDKFNSRVEKPE